MLLKNNSISLELKSRNFDKVQELLSSYDLVKANNLSVKIEVKEIITVNKDSEYEANYAIINI